MGKSLHVPHVAGVAELVDALDLGSSELACAGSSPVPGTIFPNVMINELKIKLTALGMDEEMATKALTTVAEFAKAKLPSPLHSAIDDVMAGKNPNLGALGGLLGGLKGFFGK